MSTPHQDYDGAWKEALEHYLQPLLKFCFPAVAACIDWTRPFEWLDKELQEIVREAEAGKLWADKLVKVVRLDGVEEWVLIHVEVQSQKDPRLPERMYHYHHRIADRFGRRVVSLAVLGDGQADWRPSLYEEETWGCRLRFEYLVCKLLDFGEQTGRLDEDPNPAAIIVASHLAALATAHDTRLRERFRWELTVRLHEHGYTEKDGMELMRLLDWLMRLPREESLKFRQRVIKYEEEKRMPYITTYEEFAREEGHQAGQQQGMQEGMQQGMRDTILDTLELRFGEVPCEVREAIEAVSDLATLKQFHRQALQVAALQDLPLKITP
jgi:hypothetical protein